MTRKNLIQSVFHPYHITARSNNRSYFGLEPNELWILYNDYLRFLSSAFEARIYAFVMMSNHFHLIASFPKLNMPLAMNRFMTETARAINYSQDTINHVYGRNHRACLIDNDQYYACALRYVLQNPVRAGICANVEDYVYSTLAGLMGSIPMQIPVHEYSNPVVPRLEDIENLLSFLNRPSEKDSIDATKKALNRTRFKFSGRYLQVAMGRRVFGSDRPLI